MSKVFDFSGNGGFCPGESLYPNPKESALLLSLARHVDLYFPPRKRSRITAPFVFPEERVEPKVSIDILPDECLFEIFRRLPGGEERCTSACVSKRWLSLLSNIRREEINGVQVKKSLNLKDEEKKYETDISEDGDQDSEHDGYLTRCIEGKKTTDLRLAAISVGTASRGGLGKLYVRGSTSSHRVTDTGLRAISRGCPSLKVLSLWNLPSIGDDGLSEIAKGCHLLEKLHLCNCPALSDKSLIRLANSCPNLTDLTIESCASIGNEGIAAFGRGCLNLKSVSIKNCPLVGDQGVAGILSSSGYSLGKLKLQTLNITDVSLAVIGLYGKALTDLSLTNLQNVSQKGFWVMGNGHGLQKLKSFAITSCCGVTDLGLAAVGRGCPNMKQFSLSKGAFLSDNGLVSFAKAAPSLESLKLEECHRITQFGVFGTLLNCGAKLKALAFVNCLGFKDLGLELPSAASCASLRSLSIRGCPGFGDASLSALGKLCPNLHEIDFSGLHGITDAGFLAFVGGIEAGLVKVNLSGCLNLSDKVVSSMCVEHGWTLELLNLEGCRISDGSLVAIAENCLLLSDLDVSNCGGITNVGIAALARSNKLNLQVLSASGCLISDKCMVSLKKLGETLLGLNLQKCKSISNYTENLLVEQLWRCDVLF